MASLIRKTASTDSVKSPWFRDPLTRCRWRVDAYFRGAGMSSRNKFVSLYLKKEEDKTKNAKQETRYGLFMISPTEHPATVFRVDAAIFKSSPNGSSKFASTEYILEEGAKHSDAILPGATIFR